MTELWFVVCWLVLGSLIAGHAFIRRRWVTGQTAFTGVWFASLTALWIFPSTLHFISYEAALIVICAHLCFFIGSIIVIYLIFGSLKVSPRRLEPDRNTERFLKFTGILFIVVGTVGGILSVAYSGAFAEYREGTLLLMRAMLFEQEIQLPMIVRLLSNFLYPAALFGAICFLLSERSILSWTYIVLPILGSMLYGFAFGGRGAIMITGPIVFWVLAIGWQSRFKNNIDRLGGIFIILFIFMFIGIIAGTRMDISQVAISIFQYFTGPIPAFSEWLKITPVEILKADFSNVAIVREFMGYLGSYHERSIGMDVVSIPYSFNVFTHLAEHIRDFGIIGTFITATILGILSSILEHLSLSELVMGLRAMLYTYLSFSLFAELSFFVLGWWLALFVISLLYFIRNISLGSVVEV